MPGTFYEQPILNSPYREPVYHHPLDDYGQPLDQPAVLGRRTSKFIVPVPKSRRSNAAALVERLRSQIAISNAGGKE